MKVKTTKKTGKGTYKVVKKVGKVGRNPNKYA